MRFLTFIFLVFLCFACKEEKATERISEVEFRIDSSYFDFNKIDSFHSCTLPHLIDWNCDTLISEHSTKPDFLLSHIDSTVKVVISEYDARQPNSYSYYKKISLDSSLNYKVLDLSNYIKNDLKLTQLITKSEKQTIFKVINDNPGYSCEVDIIIDNNHYNERNILLTESIIGQLNFINY